jgi:ketosteroid isomerase-like protein
MENEKNIQVVQQVYADFGKANVEGVSGALTDDIKWSDPGYPDIPYAAQRNGKSEVMNFFMEMGKAVSYTQFIPQEFFADKDAVIVKGTFAGKANATGKSFESDWVMIWKLRNGKIYSYQAWVDTLIMAKSFMPK